MGNWEESRKQANFVRMMSNPYQLSHLDELEAESMFVLREVAAQFERPAILFSGGKDSIVCDPSGGKGLCTGAHPHAIGTHRHRT